MSKNYSAAFFEEIQLLAKFPDTSQLTGIKLHKDADPEMLKAAQSLFDKGLISQKDGGYLTDSGLETSSHLQHVIAALNG